MRFFYNILRLTIILILVVGTVTVAGGLALYYYYGQDLPKIDSLADYNPPVVSEVFADDGTKIGEFWQEKRIVLAPEELPKSIVQAIVASEDDRFFEHQGIDPQGIMRAMIENIRAGHVVQGGSTITQQVTKSLLLSRERTLARKIKEAILATRIEESLTKDEILYLYLNQIFFGNRAYGVEAAAQNYFHKSAQELNIAEAAMIAGLAKAPSTYSPIANYERAKQRQEYVIQRMYEVGYITQQQSDEAKKFSLTIYRSKTDKEYNYAHAPWFTEYVRQEVQKKYGEQVPYTHGLKIYTTLDLKAQRAADRAIDRGLRELDKRQGYIGPVQQITSSEINDFNSSNHLQILSDSSEKVSDIASKSESELLLIPTPLKQDHTYKAVITHVDASRQELAVTVGNVDGVIAVHDYKWARPRNFNQAGYDDVYYVRDPSKKFAEGDVIWVKTKKISDTDLSKKGYQSDRRYFSLEQDPEVEGALFSFEQNTGFVRAIVGGKDFEKSEFNRAMQAMRQTGSVFKPILYSAALDKGYTPATIIEDAPIYYEYSPGRFWSPQNYGGGYKGPTTFRAGLVNSRNVVTVRILMDIGIDYTAAYARKLGISTPIRRYYSMALGANDMKLYEVCRAFATFATGGIRPELVFVKRITDRYGRVLEEHTPTQVTPYQEQIEKNKLAAPMDPNQPGFEMDHNQALLDFNEPWIQKDHLELAPIEKQVLYGKYIPEGYTISPRTAYTMVQLMSDIVNFGTGYKVRELKRPAAGKTGTTNDESDTWFIGYTPNLLAGVWVGFDQIKRVGSRETGGKTAAPIFLYYMQEALEGTAVAKFDIPANINETALLAPLSILGDDAEAGGINPPGDGAEFFIYDF